jgi:hypothetical protein
MLSFPWSGGGLPGVEPPLVEFVVVCPRWSVVTDAPFGGS